MKQKKGNELRLNEVFHLNKLRVMQIKFFVSIPKVTLIWNP